MKNKKLISAILAAASIAGGVVGAQAADTSTLEAKVDSYTSRVMQAETKIQDLKTKVDALDTTGIANNKAGIEANKNAIATQGTQISQIQKDMAQDAMDRAAEMDKLTTKVNQKADKADVEANKNNIASNAAAIKTETQKRENAVNGLQNQVTVASGRIDNLKNQVTANKGDIAVLQQQIKDSGQAFNAEQVNKIDANEKRSENNKNDITTIFGQLNQGAYNTQDGYAIKKDDTIGGALKNLDKNAEAEATARKDADTKLNAKIDSNAAKVQEQLDAQDNKNKAQDVSIKANGAAIKANKDAITASADAIKANKAEADATNKYFNSRIENNTANINAEVTARKDADTKLNAKIDSNAAKVQEQLDAQDNKNKAQDESIEANGAAIKANKDAIKTNADAIKANKAEADETNKYFNSRIENNTANIDKNKVAIENEVKARENAVNALNSRIDQVESDANKGIAKASALAALHPLDYDPDNKFDIAAAGGFYKGENAFALGAFYRPNRNVMLSMGTTLTGGDNAYNVGLTFKIGKSGKHMEAGLTTADLYAMIGAMQDKMDQQQKKIEELEAKQAK